MIKHDIQYIDLLKKILEDGQEKSDRTGVGTLSIFGHQMRFDLTKGFPLLTTKKMFWRGIVEELLWFIRGETNSKILEDKGVNIWKGNTSADFLKKRGLANYPDGEAGPIYGHQLRNFNGDFVALRGHIYKSDDGVDQLTQLVEGLMSNPHSRRHIITLWNPSQVDDMALPPCHGLVVQFYVDNSDKLSCFMHQRSVDNLLGLPFNIASYSLFVHLIAKLTGYKAGEFIWSGGDTHIYLNHLDAVKEQILRDPYESPSLIIKKDIQNISDLEQLQYEDLELVNYKFYPPIKARMAI